VWRNECGSVDRVSSDVHSWRSQRPSVVNTYLPTYVKVYTFRIGRLFVSLPSQCPVHVIWPLVFLNRFNHLLGNDKLLSKVLLGLGKSCQRKSMALK
jgi:hypothetical protein